MYELNVPNVAGNVANPLAMWNSANGAFYKAGMQTFAAPEYAIVNYINRESNTQLTIGFRSDLLNDKEGQRTGIATKFTENTLYATKYF